MRRAGGQDGFRAPRLVAARGVIHGANCCHLLLMEPATLTAAKLNQQVNYHARLARAIPKPSAVGSSPTGGTIGGTQVKADGSLRRALVLEPSMEPANGGSLHTAAIV